MRLAPGGDAETGWASALLLVGVVAVPGWTAPAPAADVVARNLAENVLGGTVQRVRVSVDGTVIDIAWEAVLYRSTQTVQRNREQLRAEAEIATGSIMGVMRPQVITFAILLGRRVSGNRTPDARGRVDDYLRT